jgi:UTP--glucose-1-phosphate uridylyltransferase
MAVNGRGSDPASSVVHLPPAGDVFVAGACARKHQHCPHSLLSEAFLPTSRAFPSPSPFILTAHHSIQLLFLQSKFKMSSEPHDHQLTEQTQAFENTSTNVAAAQMRNALTNLAETVKDPKEKKVGTIRRKEAASYYTAMRCSSANGDWILAVRDGNGQLLCPLPTIPQRQGQGKCGVRSILPSPFF